MKNINYKITFYSYWHAGSGQTSGSDLDALVIKDKDGLPFIPGKTLKGLLKEAADKINDIKDVSGSDFLKVVFGTENKADEERSVAGGSHFSNAELNNELQMKVLSRELSSYFFKSVSSTSIEADGIAKPHSLRRMQVTVPLVLEASILNIDERYENEMIDCLKWIKRLGQNRNRGLGRCKFEFIEERGQI